jgi:thiol:disulfide interchange protein DsbC
MMRRMRLQTNIRLFIAAIATFAVFAVVPATAQEADEELEQVRQKVNSMFEMIGPEDVNPSPIDGWYTIHRGSVVAYISASGRYLLQGDMIDLDLNINLSEAVRNDSRRVLMSAIPDDEVIAFSPTEVKYSVTVFTDVDCTYCRRLHSQIDEYLALGIEVRYLMYPRNGPKSPSWAAAQEVWCANDRNGALTAAKSDRKFPSTNCDASIIEHHYQLGQEVGLSGTPAIVFDDGTLISGYLPPDQLKLRLDELAAAN